VPSQLATLEPLTDGEIAAGSLRLDISKSPDELVKTIITALQLPADPAP
jgi:gluconokinase